VLETSNEYAHVQEVEEAEHLTRVRDFSLSECALTEKRTARKGGFLFLRRKSTMYGDLNFDSKKKQGKRLDQRSG
jgi:hypothetical protein